ncbi:hypothetical protein T11_5034 [Trichinella zimbabwensis]|uniref:Uncharacterized protein n=1 Tax=Trichinella zimbabwensis TaxID=268475 RepID=A0A0V1GB88_9BILA|nr:hypothetical protein T11_5034 [Trichinella zimbabwensis]
MVQWVDIVLPMGLQSPSVKIFDMDGWLNPSTGARACLLDVASIRSMSPLLDILANVIPLGSWEPLTSRVCGTF